MIKRVRNWSDYNKSLVKRGELLLDFEAGYFSRLYYEGEQSRGGVRIYTEEMYEFLLTVKVMLRLPWRSAVGFAFKLLQKAFPFAKILVPDYAHASREASKLDLKIKVLVPAGKEGMVLAFDSTGINVYTTSGWHQRKHGKRSLCHYQEQWKKVHLAVDLNTLQIVAAATSASTVNDCQKIEELSSQVRGEVQSIYADGAYDTQAFYKRIEDWGAKAYIPPARTSCSQAELKRPQPYKPWLAQRDAILHTIRQKPSFEEGLKEWKKKSGYHRRSQIEACMFRLKKTFGFYWQHKTDQARHNEMITKINLLNRMSALGKALYA